MLRDKARAIAAAGFTALWLPPPSDSVSQQGYLPRDLYNLTSCYGSEGELRDCISVLHENDLKVIADIVVNHRCAHTQVTVPAFAHCEVCICQWDGVLTWRTVRCSSQSVPLLHGGCVWGHVYL